MATKVLFWQILSHLPAARLSAAPGMPMAPIASMNDPDRTVVRKRIFIVDDASSKVSQS